MSKKLYVNIQSQPLVWRVVIICIAIELAFVFLDWLVNYQRGIDISQIRRLFNIAREDGLAGWFAVFQTMFVAIALWLITYVAKARGVSKWKVRGWALLAIFFSLMAIDDGAVVHERLGSAFKHIVSDEPGSIGSTLLQIFPSYSWQAILLPLFIGMGLFMLIFVWSELVERKQKYLLLAAFVPLVIAVALDFVEGLDAEHPWNLQVMLVSYFDTTTYTISHFSKSLEEFLEMLGNTMFLSLFMTHAFFSVREGIVLSVK